MQCVPMMVLSCEPLVGSILVLLFVANLIQQQPWERAIWPPLVCMGSSLVMFRMFISTHDSGKRQTLEMELFSFVSFHGVMLPV